MKTIGWTTRFADIVLVALLVQIVLFSPIAYAETYVAGQFGATFPQSLSNGKVTQDGFGGLGLSDQPLQRSAMLGLKFGHYFSKARWLGIETGFSYTTPHLKQGSITFSGPGGSTPSPILSGLHHRVFTWDMDVIFRYPGYRLQPYFGIGPSILFARLRGSDGATGQSSTALGFNAEGGLQYYLTRQWTLFGEAKYTRARMNYSSAHSDDTADPFAFRATYSVLALSVGIGYHF